MEKILMVRGVAGMTDLATSLLKRFMKFLTACFSGEIGMAGGAEIGVNLY
jgi:hypothetical protein